MANGIITLSCVPVRLSPSHKAEMVNQLLAGDMYTVADEATDGWMKISTLMDNYEGYLSAHHHTPFHTPDSFQNTAFHVAGLGAFVHSGMGITHILPGSILLYRADGRAYLNNTWQEAAGSWHLLPEVFKHEEILPRALMYLNAPYLWGGRSLYGIDCSGLVQVVFRAAGLPLPRDAWQQALVGTTISLPQAKAGDLAFYGEADDKITHVGILMDNQRIIHAHGRVRIDFWDEKGILGSETKTYSHQLRFIKRPV